MQSGHTVSSDFCLENSVDEHRTTHGLALHLFNLPVKCHLFFLESETDNSNQHALLRYTVNGSCPQPNGILTVKAQILLMAE